VGARYSGLKLLSYAKSPLGKENFVLFLTFVSINGNSLYKDCDIVQGNTNYY